MLEKIIIWGVVFFAAGFSLLLTMFTGAGYGNNSNGTENLGNIFFTISFYIVPLICILSGVAASTNYLGYTYLWLTLIPSVFILYFSITLLFFDK